MSKVLGRFISQDAVESIHIKNLNVTTEKLAELAVSTAKIANNAINNDKLADLAVTSTKLYDLAVTTDKLDNYAVTEGKLGTNSVSTLKIQDAAITNGKMAADSVGASNIINQSITTEKILDLAVTSAKINDLAVTEGKLADSAVSSVKIADDAVTELKIANDAVTTSKILDGAVTDLKLATDSVTTEKIIDSAVTSDKIVDGGVTESKLALDSVSTDKIVDLAVTSSKLAAGSVIAEKIDTGAVGTTQLADSSVTAIKLATDAVETAKIKDRNVTGVKIALSTIGMENIKSAEINVADGFVQIGSDGKIPAGLLPVSPALMTYIGAFDPSTTTLVDYVDGTAAGDHVGDVYRASAAGSHDFGSGSISFEAGDYAVCNAAGKWEKMDTSDAVTSVNGQSGTVVLTTTHIEEGTNLYFTDVRAQTAAVIDSLGTASTVKAPSVDAVNAALGTVDASITAVSTAAQALIQSEADARVADIAQLKSYHAGQKDSVNDLALLTGVAKASTTVGGIVFTADNFGVINSIGLVFDGIQDVATVVAAWNAANPSNMVSYAGTGTTVLSAQTVTISGGSNDLGSFAQTIIPDGSSIKGALQSLETAIATLPPPLPEVDVFTLTATQVNTTKYVTLSKPPRAGSYNAIMVYVKGGLPQFYGTEDDFIITGANSDQLSWDALGMDSMLAEGDKLKVIYYA